MKVFVVDSIKRAELVASRLRSVAINSTFACDTEVAEIDVKRQSPVHNGKMICFSIHVNPDSGMRMSKRQNQDNQLVDDVDAASTFWIDTLDTPRQTLGMFEKFFEAKEARKVWHNYSFDKAVMFNASKNMLGKPWKIEGFEADTMHMARLWDSSRSFVMPKAPTNNSEDNDNDADEDDNDSDNDNDELKMEESGVESKGYSLESLSKDLLQVQKTSMKELFYYHKLKKDGTPGKVKFLIPLEEVQRDEKFRNLWMYYSSLDVYATAELYNVLKLKLMAIPWSNLPQRAKENFQAQIKSHIISGRTMLDFYQEALRPFGEILTDIEIEGFQIADNDSLAVLKQKAEEDRERQFNLFASWITKCGAFKNVQDAKRFNLNSAPQKQMLFYGKNGILQPSSEHVRRVEREVLYAKRSGDEEKVQKSETALKKLLEEKKGIFNVENIEQIPNGAKGRVLKYREIEILGLGIEPKIFTKSGFPSTAGTSLKKLQSLLMQSLSTGKVSFPDANLFNAFGGAAGRREALDALGGLLDVNNIDKMLSTFIGPLSTMTDITGRLHCSLNLNTETGRLSSRRPNLQNQPALEKDKYMVRDAFIAKPGNTLIVADYGQLELRILAEITNCKSMKEAFIKGGGFHSRTAMGMYDYIAEAERKGEVLLEKPPGFNKDDPKFRGKEIKLIKDVYAAERRKAKVLNFSIAYGKTVFGLAQDFGVTEREAEETVNRWYSDRPEVRAWQQNTIDKAIKTGRVYTIWGRHRDMKGITGLSPAWAKHMQRAAINTPIQGSAADVVMGAMIRVSRNDWLRDNGWKMILQVHDEIILEGPKETAQQALDIVVALMKDPFSSATFSDSCSMKLDVELTVDAHYADTWYKAK